MLNLNHQKWGKLWFKNQRLFIAIAIVIASVLFGTLVADAAREVVIFADGESKTVTVYSNDPHVILQQAGLPDTDEYALEETNDGLMLRVGPEFIVTLNADGKTTSLITRAERVGAILAAQGIVLKGDDRVIPDADTILYEDTVIQVERVTYQSAVHKEPVEPSVTYVDSDALAEGTTAEEFEGVPGVAEVTRWETLVNGEVTESVVLTSTVIKQPQDKIVLRGTAPTRPVGSQATTNAALNAKMASPLAPETPLAVDENGVPLHYQRCITGLATAYYADEGAHTSTGEIAQLGYVAVDPKEIPYGSKLFIRTVDGSFYYGYAKAADTGGFISGPVEVDLYFPTLYECTRFGLRTVEIYVLD